MKQLLDCSASFNRSTEKKKSYAPRLGKKIPRRQYTSSRYKIYMKNDYNQIIYIL